MKQVYSPANAAEAHMLAHLLGQEGITAHIHGEALQGGVGELPAAGLLQLLVADDDFELARAIVTQWERAQPQQTSEARSRTSMPLLLGIGIFALGLLGGWAIRTAALSNAVPIDIAEQHVDLNGDGDDDATYFYRIGANYAYKGETDRNFDNAVDLTEHYDANGVIERTEADEDFDGAVESRTYFEEGSARRTDIGAGRGRAGTRRYYRSGIPSREEITAPDSGRIVRINYYASLRLERAEIDLDRDGTLETVRVFDEFGEVTSEVRQSR